MANSYIGFLQPWIINMYLYITSADHMLWCVWFGLWGLLFGNDSGVLAEQCMTTGLLGSKATYYESAE